MSIASLLISGVVILSVFIIVNLAYLCHWWLQTRHARQQHAQQHRRWPHQYVDDIELKAIQTENRQNLAFTRWPRNSRDKQESFVSTRIFAIRPGSTDVETPLQCPAPVRTSVLGGPSNESFMHVPVRKKTTESEDCSGLPYSVGPGEDSDLSREIWRKVEAR